MKTTVIFSTLIAVLFFNLTIANAQNEIATVSNQTNYLNENSKYEVSPVATPIDVAPHFRKEVLSVDAKNSMVQLNYELSGFSNGATLQIQDFTGRILKTFKVNTLDTSNNQFLIADLLSGTYKYVLMVDNQKKLTGEFTLNEY